MSNPLLLLFILECFKAVLDLASTINGACDRAEQRDDGFPPLALHGARRALDEALSLLGFEPLAGSTEQHASAGSAGTGSGAGVSDEAAEALVGFREGLRARAMSKEPLQPAEVRQMPSIAAS